MSYRPLKPITGVTGPDPTGRNQGNLTTSFDSSTMGMPGVNVWEIYHMAVSGGPPLAYATIILAGQPYSTVTLDGFGSNEWDPQQPAEIRGDQAVYFLWNQPAAVPLPGLVVTMWGRFDPALPENKGFTQ